MTPAKRPCDVRLGYCEPSIVDGSPNPYDYTDSKSRRGMYGGLVKTIPVAIVDLQPEAQERLVAKVAEAIRKAEHDSPRYFSREMAARAVLAALFGAKKGRK